MESPPFQYNLDIAKFSYDVVTSMTTSEEKAIAWSMAVGLLDRTRLCSECALPMRLSVRSKRWRCCRRRRHANNRELSQGLLVGSFFEKAKIPVHKAVRLMFAWCMREPQVRAAEMANVCVDTVCEWYAFLRAICPKELLRTDCQIGGVGHVVEIDETCLAKKQKYGRGAKHEEFWLFGGVDRTTGRWFGRIVKDDRTKKTLLPIVKSYIKPRTLIMSDMFASYVCERGEHQYMLANKSLATMQYAHQWVNHSLHFVDPETGAHTNTIEGLSEMHIKRHIKRMRGMRSERLDAYIDEYMWRSWYSPPRATGDQYMCGLVTAIRRNT